MPRSDRSLILPAIFGLIFTVFAFGWALGGDWALQPNEQTKKPSASKSAYEAAQARGTYAAYPIEESNACYRAKDHDSADLCAQWRAAIAAEKAANAANWGNRLSVIGAVLSTIGLVALLATIRQGDAALRFAQSSFEQQSRPWLTLNITNIFQNTGASQFFISMSCDVKNIGQTPAFSIRYGTAIFYLNHGDDWDEVFAKTIKEIKSAFPEPKGTIFPGETLKATDRHYFDLSSLPGFAVSVGGAASGPYVRPNLMVVVEYIWGQEKTVSCTAKSCCISYDDGPESIIDVDGSRPIPVRNNNNRPAIIKRVRVREAT